MVETARSVEPGAGLGDYRTVRAFTERLCSPLTPEDCVVQSMPDASPAKWHLAHTTWFFEAFVLKAFVPAYRPYHPLYHHLFNSYYLSVGSPWPRARRGTLSRPTLDEVYEYRHAVDESMLKLLEAAPAHMRELALEPTVIGLNHEQQHQELILTDLKTVLAGNPLAPVYRPPRRLAAAGGNGAPQQTWFSFPAGVYSIGYAGSGFAYDNERPRHRVFLQDFELASRPVTNGEFLAFIEDGGYSRSDLWLSDGWFTVMSEQWRKPLYWELVGGEALHHALSGLQPLERESPVCHLSYYEADAYARWAGARLPTEAEWETAAADAGIDGNFAEDEALEPLPAGGPDHGLRQMFGDVWEWTQSAYLPYPGFTPLPGALGEYNGKFMCGQQVLRGGSCATPRSHIRASYRNFFPPAARWQFTGLRLARG